MDPFVIGLWLLRLAFLALLYLFLALVARALWRDVRTAVVAAGAPLGQLVVIAAADDGPAPGTVLPLDAVNSLGRDVNNSVVVEDAFASAEHARLTFRGRSWYVEDLGSTNGTYVNGERIEEVAPVAYGDELQVGHVRFRLERPERGTAGAGR